MKPPVTRRRLLGALASAALPTRLSAQTATVIFAAASLSEVLPTLAVRLAPDVRVNFSFAASSTLARQIEQGAPAHVFVSADEAWMDYLVKRQQVDLRSRRVLAGNRLVVVRPGITPLNAPPAETLSALRDALRADARGSGRVATGDPAHVPAGRYARAALTALGLWSEVAPRLVRADNVRSALNFVERGEADAGIVYATDARAARGVRVAAAFPLSSHPPIRYPAALVRGAPRLADVFLEKMSSPDAQAIWRAAGFAPAL